MAEPLTPDLEYRVKAIEIDMLEMANLLEEAVEKLAQVASIAISSRTRLGEIETRLNQRS